MKKTINIPINQDILKIIALLTMTIDHFGYIFTPSFETPLRLIGRISFPIFVFLIAYNLTQKDLFKKYFSRLSLFAAISSLILIPLKCQLVNILPLNIFWTFLLGIFTIYGINCSIKLQNKTFKYILISYIFCFSALLSFLTDYEFFGLIYILSMYGWFKNRHISLGLLILISSFAMNFHISVWASAISCFTSLFFLLPLSKSENAKRFLKPWWLFYAYYPVHLAILYIIKIYF